VVDRLKIPFQFPGPGIERDHGVGEQVIALAVSSPVIRIRTAEDGVEDAALGIHRQSSGSSATIALAVPKYITPRTTMGVNSEPPIMPAAVDSNPR
jgi:hypothetical protein